MSKQKRLTKEAFSEIYLENYDDMKSFAAKRFFAAGRTDPHQVLDAVQETFRILCEKPESYQNSPSPSGWLYVTLTYVIQNQLRQENRQTKLLAKAQDAWAEEVQPPPGADLELDGMLQQEIAVSGEESLDTDYIQAILEVIREKEGMVIPSQEAKESLKAFFENYWQEPAEETQPVQEEPEQEPKVVPLHPKRKKHRAPRKAVAAAAVACILACTLTVPVQGSNLMESFVHWTTATFSFQQEETPGESSVFQDTAYQEAQKKIAERTDVPALPNWYPEGSKLLRVEEGELTGEYDIHLTFSLQDKIYSVDIAIGDKISTKQYEKSDTPIEEHYVKGRPFYIMKNIERETITWKNGNIQGRIQGFLTADQLKRMANSIYEGE